jgi:hypothetical protein
LSLFEPSHCAAQGRTRYQLIRVPLSMPVGQSMACQCPAMPVNTCSPSRSLGRHGRVWIFCTCWRWLALTGVLNFWGSSEHERTNREVLKCGRGIGLCVGRFAPESYDEWAAYPQASAGEGRLACLGNPPRRCTASLGPRLNVASPAQYCVLKLMSCDLQPGEAPLHALPRVSLLV